MLPGSTDGCQTVLKFGPEAVDLDLDMTNIDDDCMDVLATLPNWSPGEARKALNNIAQIKVTCLRQTSCYVGIQFVFLPYNNNNNNNNNNDFIYSG